MYPPEPIARLLKRLSGPATAGDRSPAEALHESLLLGLFTFRDTLAREVMPRMRAV
jgi:hypothetical protein